MDDPAFKPVAHVSIYHEGPTQEGHWSWSADNTDVFFDDPNRPSQLSGLAPFFLTDQRLTETGLGLLKKYVKLNFEKRSVRPEAFGLILLTAAQIEKFIHNINYVNTIYAQKLLGPHLTKDALEFIQAYPEPQIEYDESLLHLIKANLTDDDEYGLLKLGHYTTEQYRTALCLLTPPAVLPFGSLLVEEREVRRVLRADEVSGLMDLNMLLFHEGLSDALYEVCNKPDITPLLTDEFLCMLMQDSRFMERAGEILQERVKPFWPRRTTLSPLDPVTALPDSPSPTVIVSPTARMIALMENVKERLSTKVLMGISRDSKSVALDTLILKTRQPDANLPEIYQALIWVVTTHRTRFGACFFHMSRHNSSSTDTAIALSRLLLSDFQDLKATLNITATQSQDLRDEWDQLVQQRDYYPFDHNICKYSSITLCP